MRWFKHLTDASDDDFLQELEEKFGWEGYGRWWKLCEVIGKTMEAKAGQASRSLPWSVWQTKLKGKRKQLRCFLECLANQGRISLEETGDILVITLPKLLKYRDEYQKKSGVTSDKLRSLSVSKSTENRSNREQSLEKDSKANLLSGSESEPDASAAVSLPEKLRDEQPELASAGENYNALAAKWSKPRISPKRLWMLRRRFNDFRREMAKTYPEFTTGELLARVEKQPEFFRDKWHAWDLEWFLKTRKGEFVNASRAWTLAYAETDRGPPRPRTRTILRAPEKFE